MPATLHAVNAAWRVEKRFHRVERCLLRTRPLPFWFDVRRLTLWALPWQYDGVILATPANTERFQRLFIRCECYTVEWGCRQFCCEIAIKKTQIQCVINRQQVVNIVRFNYYNSAVTTGRANYAQSQNETVKIRHPTKVTVEQAVHRWTEASADVILHTTTTRQYPFVPVLLQTGQDISEPDSNCCIAFARG